MHSKHDGNEIYEKTMVEINIDEINKKRNCTCNILWLIKWNMRWCYVAITNFKKYQTIIPQWTYLIYINHFNTVFFANVGASIIWLKYCRYGVNTIQSSNQSIIEWWYKYFILRFFLYYLINRWIPLGYLNTMTVYLV